jgi:hypothetical protein
MKLSDWYVAPNVSSFGVDEFLQADDNSEKSAEQPPLQRQVQTLVERIRSKSSVDQFLFLYFDEIHSLIPVDAEMDDKNRWDVLTWTLAAITSFAPRDVFCLSLSTRGLSPVMSRPKPPMRSARLLSEDVVPPPPNTSAPFDVRIDGKYRNPWVLTPAEMCTVDYLAQFGRPLYVFEINLCPT